eukprot:4410792-Amphidinium_carterae.1
MGDNLPYIDLGQGVVSVATVASDETPAVSCAVLVDNSIKCWGESATYGFGYGDTLPRGSTLGTMGNALPNVGLGVRAHHKELNHSPLVDFETTTTSTTSTSATTTTS